ncbi:hypothetical protein ACLMJK_006179 [Lecanora helva]
MSSGHPQPKSIPSPRSSPNNHASSVEGGHVGSEATHSLSVTEQNRLAFERSSIANLAEDELPRRRHRSRNSGGFLLEPLPTQAIQSRLPNPTNAHVSEKAKGKRRVEDGDLILPKRPTARHRHKQRVSLGSSPLATEVSNAQALERSGSPLSKQTASSPAYPGGSVRSSINSNDTSSTPGASPGEINPKNRISAFGPNTDPAQIVNLALNLSESRRRNISNGGLIAQRDVAGGKRVISSSQPPFGMPNGAPGGSLRQYLNQQRQISRNVSPRSGRSTSSKGVSPDLSQQAREEKRSSPAFPDFGIGFQDSSIIDPSDATLTRAEKARVAIELSYQYRRLLQWLPRLSGPPRRRPSTGKAGTKSQNQSLDTLGRSYNPLQYIRNRKIRFKEDKPLDSEAQGWTDIEAVRSWVDTVISEREDGLSRIDNRFPLPAFDPSCRGLAINDNVLTSGLPPSRARKIARPHNVWEIASWDLLADAYWLNQGDHVTRIEDSHGKKLFAASRPSEDYLPRTSRDSARVPARRSESLARLNQSPEKARKSLESFRTSSKERGRRRWDRYEPQSPVSDENASQTRKSRWSRRFVRSKSPSSSGDSHRRKRRGHVQGLCYLNSRDDYSSAVLEKHMMDILAKEAEEHQDTGQKTNLQAASESKPNDNTGHDGEMNGEVRQGIKSRPSALKRLHTDIPVAERHQASSRASLDEEKLVHHSISSDDLQSTAPNSPRVPGFVPSIAINLSPPASPPTSALSMKRALPARSGYSQKNRSPNGSLRAISDNEFALESGTSTDVSRQTTTESQLVNMLRRERSLDARGLLSPSKSDFFGRGSRNYGSNIHKSDGHSSQPDSKLRGLFKGGRIAEIVGSEVSKVGDRFWRRESGNNSSQLNSPAASNYGSEDSDVDDGDVSGLDNSPENGVSRTMSRTDGKGRSSQGSAKSERPKFYMDNLPTFRSTLNNDASPESLKVPPDQDHISRQQMAMRERGRPSRFDRLAPPKIDMRSVSPSPSRSPSPDQDNDRSRSSGRVRSADRRLNAMLNIPGKIRVHDPAPTGLSGVAISQPESRGRPTAENKRQWSISNRSVSAIRGTITRRDVARVRALLLSSGVKANEIVRRAEETPETPSPFLKDLEHLNPGKIPHLPRYQEYSVGGHMLINNIETTSQDLRKAAEEFLKTDVGNLHDQLKAIDDHVNYSMTPLVRAAADDADTFSTELTTTHTLSVKQLNDSINLILRRRRRRLRWIRRTGWTMVEWTLLGMMWLAWLIVFVIRLLRGIIRGFVRARSFIDSRPLNSKTKPSVHDSDAVILPGSQSTTAPNQPPPPGPILSASPTAHPTSTAAKDTAVPPQNVPLAPPSPPSGKEQTSPSSSVSPAPAGAAPIPPTTPPGNISNNESQSQASPPPPPPPSPPPKRKSRRLLRSLQTLILLIVIGYVGGTWYSLISDNFHDFFTEYVPFGEDLVLYFEEREFRKRFPNATNPSHRPSADAGGNKVTIPSKSGVSWKIAGEEHQSSDLQTRGRHMSALDTNHPGAEGQAAQRDPSSATGQEKDVAVKQVKKEAPATPKSVPTDSKLKQDATKRLEEPQKAVPKSTAPEPKPTDSPKETTIRSPEVNEPSRVMPLQAIDPLKIQHADEPLVQDLVKIFNDIITVVNNDNSSHKYATTIDKAKSQLANVGQRILSLKEAERTFAKAEIESKKLEFEKLVEDSARRFEEEMRDEYGRWRDEYESEREKIAHSSKQRLRVETERLQQVSEQQQRNKLLEQAVALKKQFLSEVTDRVETERNGRLSKLSDLSSSVSELENLTADWNSVIDANLKTQHLQVAVEAVRSTLETADRPRPFIRELAALKELATDDSVVSAAISSMNPTAYQRGVPTVAQLIDRFRRVAAEVRKASLLPEDAGVASHAASFVLSKFMFKKQGMTVGEDVESVLTRTETLLEEGNLDEAAREMNTLDGWAKNLSFDWLSECRRVLEVRQAMDVIAAEARLEGLKVD